MEQKQGVNWVAIFIFCIVLVWAACNGLSSGFTRDGVRILSPEVNAESDSGDAIAINGNRNAVENPERDQQKAPVLSIFGMVCASIIILVIIIGIAIKPPRKAGVMYYLE